jgi:hypothetical protein
MQLDSQGLSIRRDKMDVGRREIWRITRKKIKVFRSLIFSFLIYAKKVFILLRDDKKVHLNFLVAFLWLIFNMQKFKLDLLTLKKENFLTDIWLTLFLVYVMSS